MADCIRDSMEWWGTRVQWNGSLMGGDKLHSGWGGRVSGSGMLGGECNPGFVF